MEIHKTTTIFFSPTGTGKKTANEIAAGMPFEHASIDLTTPEVRRKNYQLESNELAIIAVPVYGGRVPQTAIDRIKNIRGRNTPTVIVAMYGNRAYEDALLELKNIIIEQGFKTIAGAAFIGQHSYNTKENPIAPERPDSDDLKIAYEFGVKVSEKLQSKEEVEGIEIQGNYPYRQRGKREPRSPETGESLCVLCGACERVCPTGCIRVSNIVETQKVQCIACTACVQACPTGSRHWENEGILKTTKRLATEHGDRKEPQMFL